MRLPPEGARWLVTLRFGAAAAVFLLTTLAWAVGVLSQPAPLYIIGGVLLAYNLLFKLSQSDWARTREEVERNIFLQILFDLAAQAPGFIRSPGWSASSFCRSTTSR